MSTALKIWDAFCNAHAIQAHAVPLFLETADQTVAARNVGRTPMRPVLCRHQKMEQLVIEQVNVLISDWHSGKNHFDGLIYMMFRQSEQHVVTPLYIGKTETFGKSSGNLSVNLKNLKTDKSKFARWGDGYAYHIGDLSAAALPGHPSAKINRKYRQWATTLFKFDAEGRLSLRQPVYFWAKAWRPSDTSIWRDLSPTRLAFLEYLMIGIASAVFPNHILNTEGRNRNPAVDETT